MRYRLRRETSRALGFRWGMRPVGIEGASWRELDVEVTLCWSTASVLNRPPRIIVCNTQKKEGDTEG